MFKKALTIENVNKGYCISNNQLTFQSGREIVQYDMVGKKESHSSTLVYYFKKFEMKGDVLVGVSTSECVFCDSQLISVEAIAIEAPVCDFSLYNDRLIVVRTDYDYSLFLSKQGIKDIFLGSIIWEAGFGENIRVESNIAFTVSFKGVARRNLANGEVQWSVEKDSGRYLPELVGVADDTVIFCFKGLDKIAAFDIKTGKVKYEIKTFAKGLCIDEEKGLLHQMLVNYAAYDLLTGELKDNYQDFSYFESVGIETQRSNYVLEGGHIITTDRKEGIIGAFNTLTHKFDWVHKMGGVSFPSPAPIVYQDPYLLLYDNLGALHIFERSVE
ncbi:PQQ-like beta-propeller repeat protein [Microbulbifer variabilis]|uniref:PQQ-like beta-propeller repeat protein n=1 Tax=Microbulbifer variabilis TaxID=266805 RepID=UPI001CFCE416|nr:PQQ-like beta-propeller repeat protein [Microbulbifer variabilis]